MQGWRFCSSKGGKVLPGSYFQSFWEKLAALHMQPGIVISGMVQSESNCIWSNAQLGFVMFRRTFINLFNYSL